MSIGGVRVSARCKVGVRVRVWVSVWVRVRVGVNPTKLYINEYLYPYCKLILFLFWVVT